MVSASQSIKKYHIRVNHQNDLFQVVELHDCFSANELITYEALGLCGEGKAGELIDRCLQKFESDS